MSAQELRVAAGRVGEPAAWAFTFLIVALNLMYVPLLITARPWRGVEDYLATVRWVEFGPQAVGLVALPVFAVLLIAVHRATPPERSVLSLAAVGFGLAFVATVWVGYVVQVAWVYPNAVDGVDAGIELLAFRNPRGLGWALNHAGWALSGMAALALAGTFPGRGREAGLRWLLAGYGLANLLLIPAYATGSELLSLPAAVSWLVVLPAISVQLGRWFRQARRPVAAPGRRVRTGRTPHS
jgi:hypothetical protein